MGALLSEELELPLYKELTNPYTHELLNRFYRDKSRWAFTLQVHFLNERFRKIKRIMSREGGVLDRSIYGDRIFAEVLYEDGDMQDFEFHTYSALLENMLEHASSPRLLVYLDCSVDTALRRIRVRDRGIESTIPRDYLERLNRHYLAWYDQYNISPKIKMDTERYPINTESGREVALRKINAAIPSRV